MNLKSHQFLCLLCIVAIVLGCSEDEPRRPLRRSQTTIDATRHRLVSLYYTAGELHRNKEYPDLEAMFGDDLFLKRIADNFDEDISNATEIVDAWGHTLKIEWVDIPDSEHRDLNVSSPGENGVWGDDDDQAYPWTVE